MKLLQQITKIIIPCALVFLIAGCTKNFEGINTDPRLVSDKAADPALILTKVQKESMFNLMEEDGRIEVYSGYVGNTALGNVFAKGPWEDPFAVFYTNYLINIAEVIRLSANEPKLANLNAFGRIWKVWLYSRLTDLYGDIPYTEAVQNVNEVKVTPAYDSQESIYNDLLKELKESVAVLKEDDGTRQNAGSHDLIYKGNVENWIRLGNSLRLRLATRISYVNPSLSSANINDVINEPLITENAQNAVLVAGNAAVSSNNNKNPYYNGIAGGAKEFRWASFTMVETLTKLQDPRIKTFMKLSSNNDYFGLFLNLSTPEKAVDLGRPANSDSELGDMIWKPDFTFTLMNAAETYFLRAEAALKAVTSEDPQALYEQGIEKSLDNFNVSPTDKTDYLDGSAAVLTGTEEEKFEMIIIQKWLANYFQMDEGYAEFRRTGYPKIWSGTAPGDTNGEIPRRVQYPLSEYNANNVSITAAVKKLSNGDSYTSKVWWDANPDVPRHHPKQGTFPPY